MARRKNSRRISKAGFDRRTAGEGVAPKAILVVTEGAVTEPCYLRTLAKQWQIHAHVLTLEPGGEGIPGNLVNLATKEIKDRKNRFEQGKLAINQVEEFDEVWIVFDTEHAARQGKLTEGVHAANKEKFRIAHSTPCFEFWLALHFRIDAPPMNCYKEARDHFEKVAGLPRGTYEKDKNTSQPIIEGLVPKVVVAVRNADKLANRTHDEPFPANPSTTVQDLIRSLHEALPTAFQERFKLPPPPSTR